MKDRWRMSPGLRRSSAVVAIAALAISGAKIASDHSTPGSGFSTVATVAADPTGGPTGGPGGPGGMNGSQFQPPGLPPQMPDYQGGINQPPLDQNSGISIYNTGSPGAQQVPGQQGAQQPQQSWDQPAHGTQIPDYQTNPGYTQGPGKPNPDYQAPQQQAPQQGQQPQQPQQGQQQQPENRQDDGVQQMDQQKQQKCMNAATNLGYLPLASGGGGSLDMLPADPLTPLIPCNGACSQLSQPGGKHAIQKNVPPQKADDPKVQQQLDQLKQDAKKCGGGDIMGDVAQIVGGVGGVIASLPAIAFFGLGFVTGAASAYGVVDGVSKIADCTRSSSGITRVGPGK